MRQIFFIPLNNCVAFGVLCGLGAAITLSRIQSQSIHIQNGAVESVELCLIRNNENIDASGNLCIVHERKKARNDTLLLQKIDFFCSKVKIQYTKI